MLQIFGGTIQKNIRYNNDSLIGEAVTPSRPAQLLNTLLDTTLDSPTRVDAAISLQSCHDQKLFDVLVPLITGKSSNSTEKIEGEQLPKKNRDEVFFTRILAAVALQGIQDEAVISQLLLSINTSQHAQTEGVCALALNFNDNISVVNGLIDLVNHPKPRLALTALQALGSSENGLALVALNSALSHENPTILKWTILVFSVYLPDSELICGSLRNLKWLSLDPEIQDMASSALSNPMFHSGQRHLYREQMMNGLRSGKGYSQVYPEEIFG